MRHMLFGLLVVCVAACGGGSSYRNSVWKDYDIYNSRTDYPDNDSSYRLPRGYRCDSKNYSTLGCE